MDRLVQDYINRLTITDLEKFALSNGITLNEFELNLIFDNVKNNWRTVIYGNPRGVLDELKSKVNPVQYQKIENLYIQFKNRYSNFLPH